MSTDTTNAAHAPALDQLPFLTIAEASRLIRSKALSPVTLTRALLDRIERLDSQVHAYVTLCPEEAMAAARVAEQAIQNGGWLGPLHGIPMGIKDIIDVAGTPTTSHSALCKSVMPEADATVIERLKNAGAIVLGKTATWEFAIGGTSFDLPWPPARNPWDLSRDTSGSSSGSAAAAAAGMGIGTLGTDTGGSIRGPSAWTGIAGLKPTYGLVSRHGVMPLSFSQDHVGPMCWTSWDCAAMMQALAGFDPRDPASADSTPQDYLADIDKSPKDLRIGVVRHFFEEDAPANDDITAAVNAAVQVFVDAGCDVKSAQMLPLQEYIDISTLIERAEGFAVHGRTLSEHPELYGQLSRIRIGAGAFLSASDYLNALRRRANAVAHARTLMRRFDLLILPTRGMSAMPIGEYDPLKTRAVYTRPFNVLGMPALSVCSGFGAHGMPLNVQIAGRPFEDKTVLRAGHFLETQLGLRGKRPVL